MRKLLSYILLCAALFIGACTQDEAISQGEGAVSFRIELPQTRTYDPMQTLVVRIFKADGGLIRRYSSIDDMPESLMLIAGDYKITVEAGDKKTTTWSDKSYYGELPFTVEANKTTTAKVTCKAIHVGAKVNLDATISKFEQGAYVYISASNIFDVETIAQVPTLKYESIADPATGYFLLPKGVTNLSWQFHGQSEKLGTVVQTGVIENVSAAMIYSLKFQYSKTPDGFAQITVKVDESSDDHYDDIGFSPQPTIKGEDWSMNQTAGYHNNKLRFNVSSIKPLSKIVMTANGTEYTIFDTAQTPEAIAGIIYESVDTKKANIELQPEFLSAFTTGYHTISFAMTDDSGNIGSGKVKMAVAGLLEATEFDPWLNTTTLRAIVTDPAATDVKIAYRTDNGAWQEGTTTKDADFIYTLKLEPKWTPTTNLAAIPETVYTLDTSSALAAGKVYEYKLLVNNIDKSEVISFSTLTAAQTIHHGSMEDGSLSCFTENNISAPYWGSGNNSFSKSLCSQATYAGSEGQFCAKLAAAEPVGMLAAGNLFTGPFDKPGGLFGTTGYVSFGWEYAWTARPRALKVKYYAQHIGKVDISKHSGAPIKSGDQDVARIFVAIIDWKSQHVVSSGTSAPTGIWNPSQQSSVDAGKIIAYGLLDINESSTGEQMIDVEIPLHYYNRTTKPSGKYTLVISAATSAYGDYMVGCKSNVMYVDDFRWAY